ncbi:hypothetical protein H6G80_13710 [Nostoc sp. FACHB-87]|uniref:hypothetical protein n=1 Tax=Nostocales TaxID=1161 RepID=UPI001687736A|nr:MULTISPECIES: hypothetical protein [Nostocales]MBD2300887.1 hypothetical protein [Nostoc sp. FACHB-190]MBD2455138.1 hypothetical protein [Nostoc sp. FACHB-87]MBD2477854.1 hypothetical protein [Anabaena sp. FACHB-83]MBD2487267.1 hypothetical protein [Aulosira sp. FACHB-615]
MFLKSFGGVVVAMTLLVGNTAIAQTTDTQLAFHIQVGSDNDGNPIILDAGSVQGSEYTILQKQGNGVTKTTFRASCAEGRLFSETAANYSADGQLVSEKPTKQEITPQPGTPEANSMEIVCQSASKEGNQ